MLFLEPLHLPHFAWFQMTPRILLLLLIHLFLFTLSYDAASINGTLLNTIDVQPFECWTDMNETSRYAPTSWDCGTLHPPVAQDSEMGHLCINAKGSLAYRILIGFDCPLIGFTECWTPFSQDPMYATYPDNPCPPTNPPWYHGEGRGATHCQVGTERFMTYEGFSCPS